ncbi:MAG: HigA family addiction module antitoxin [Psychrosphaera sp.]|nr:HigA family addiction module antitoxin [Psychrosphaera sp.]
MNNRSLKRPVRTVGEILKTNFLTPLELNITQAAKYLGVTRVTISNLVNGGRMPDEMAKRLAVATQTSVEYWINAEHMRRAYHAATIEVETVPFPNVA